MDKIMEPHNEDAAIALFENQDAKVKEDTLNLVELELYKTILYTVLLVGEALNKAQFNDINPVIFIELTLTMLFCKNRIDLFLAKCKF
jgi:hypothetical protein